MLFMNDYDIETAVLLWEREDTTEHGHIRRLASTLDNLRVWANDHSDGWHSWPKPCRAAKTLQEVVQQCERMYRAGMDIETIGDYAFENRLAALRPVKAFLTRQGAAHSEVIR